MAGKQVSVPPSARLTVTDQDGRTNRLTDDLGYQRLLIVNVVYYGQAGSGDRPWVLIDTGVMGSTTAILHAVAERFGKEARPAAIIQTHGHFDHAGALEELARRWDVPVYAHRLEFPYLNGRAAYPRPDPSVGGGMMAMLSRFYPRGPVDVRPYLQPLADDCSVPFMPGWQWIHVPGHTPGQIALWREADRTLIAGDAFVTTRQESAYAVMMQRPELHGPPMYYTQDWNQARRSVRRLAELEPERVITGHGPPLQGPAMRAALHKLADNFDRLALPEQGRYLHQPANLASGNAYAPPS